MGDLVEAVTSDRGVFAALTAVFGLVAVVVGLVRPVLKSRRDAAGAVPDLQLASITVEPPPDHSDAGVASFELVNVRGGTAVLRDLLLEIRDHGPLERPRMTVPAAPVPQFTY